MVANSSTRRKGFFRLPLEFTLLGARQEECYARVVRMFRLPLSSPTARFPSKRILPARRKGTVEQDSQGSSDKVFPQTRCFPKTSNNPEHFLEIKGQQQPPRHCGEGECV